MVTKYEENLTETLDVRELKGKYLAERLLRTWNEDFVDEDSGEVVSIPRNEVVMEKGTLLLNDELSQVNFFIQEGGVKSILVSDMRRTCIYDSIGHGLMLWEVTVGLNSKSKKVYMYASCLEMAIEICVDYCEQNFLGVFSIKTLKELSFATIVEEKEELLTDGVDSVDLENNNTYKIIVEFKDEMNLTESTFIVVSTNAEEGKDKVVNKISELRAKEKNENSFEVKLLSATIIKCDSIVPLEFSKTYNQNFKYARK